MDGCIVVHETPITFGIQIRHCTIDLIGNIVHILLLERWTIQHYQGTHCLPSEYVPHHDTTSRSLSSVRQASWVQCFMGLSPNYLSTVGMEQAVP